MTPPTAPVPDAILFTIRFNPSTGGVEIQGPLANRLFCYGLLEMAREILAKQGPPANQSRITVPKLVF